MRLWRTRAWCVHDAPGVSVPAGATAGAADNLRLEPAGAETGSIRPEPVLASDHFHNKLVSTEKRLPFVGRLPFDDVRAAERHALRCRWARR
jgi:hypothetical protein